MFRYALLVEYDGGPFCGWQRQAQGLPSVQAALETALARCAPGASPVQGAGRTDTGVHASGQVAHVDLSREWDPFRLAGAINWHLRPEPIAVLAAARVDGDFHARFSATARHYLYRIHCRRAGPVLERGRVWQVPQRIDTDAMRAAAAHLVGRHDFTTFRAAQCQSESPVKTLDRITLTESRIPGGWEIALAFHARSFLHSQVRSMVGTLERVGAGAWTAADLAAALAARDRAACGPVAPPQGLCLTGVSYPIDPFALETSE